MPTYFTEHFEIDPKALERYGAFNVSLVTDLPLFIDPFLLFNSKKKKYRALHDEIIRYLEFLRDRAVDNSVDLGLLGTWYRFPEVKQTWLGFTVGSNRGRGLGRNFAIALRDNLNRIFADFGHEKITKGSHLEKLCLIREGVGRDNISDFTTNLIKGFLCEYTQEFARAHVTRYKLRAVSVPKVSFNYETEVWEPRRFELPWDGRDYVLLTPKEILTRDDTWINKTDLLEDFDRLPAAIPDQQLRAQVNNYFKKVLVRRKDKEPTRKDIAEAARKTILQHPALIDIYIRFKEDHGDRAVSISSEKVNYSQQLYVGQFQALCAALAGTQFYKVPGNTYEEAHERITFLKDVIENKGGHRFFYVKGEPLQRETDVHILYLLTWCDTASDVSREVNDGRGPADFKVSRGSRDKTIVEFKLAKNPQLARNLERQAEIYKKASGAKNAIKVIFYFSAEELRRVNAILKRVGLAGHQDVVLIDARKDNKPSASKA